MEQIKRDRIRAKLLRGLPKHAVVAEIGVWEGGFSQKIVEICAPSELHLIDPWQYMPEFANTGFGRLKNADLMEEKYQSVVALFRENPAVQVHRATSRSALSAMSDGSLDWVYVDGNHNEPFISEDLELCLRKVKPNGLICGDDYNWQSTSNGAPVRHAVEALMARLGSHATLSLMSNQYQIQLACPAVRKARGKAG